MSSRGARLKDEGTKLQVVSAGAVAGLVSRFVLCSMRILPLLSPASPFAKSTLKLTLFIAV
jgi:solute carrier family 25 (mitochondrial thiamine pyrophosphate transporter), member 19